MRRRVLRWASIVLLGGFLAVPLAGASFSAAFYASPAGQSSSKADVGVDAGGNAVFAWETFVKGSGDIAVQTRPRSAAGALGPTQTLSTADYARYPRIGVDGDRDSLAVWQLGYFADGAVQARFRSKGGALGPITAIASNPGASANPKVAVNAGGQAVFVWTGRDSTGKYRVYGRARSAGGALSPILLLSAQNAGNPQVAIGPQGAAVFVWVRPDGNDNNLIEARTRTAGGALGTVRVVAKGIGYPPNAYLTGNPEVDVDDDGDALVVWEQPNGEGPCGFNGCPQVLSRALSKDGALGIQQLLTTTELGGRYPQVSLDADGNAVVAWLRGDRVQARSRSREGVLGGVQVLSGPDAGYRLVLEGDRAGNTVAAWQLGIAGRVQARSRSSVGALGVVRTFSIGSQKSYSPRLAVSDTGKAEVSWEQTDGLGQCDGTSCLRVGGATGP